MNIAVRPLVSVVVPVYNVEHYLDECMDSIKRQTYPNLEIVVVEDCSTDGSLQVLEPHLTDPRVRLLRHERNGGLSAARNTGIEAATGDYVMFVDSDDVVDENLVQACVDAATQTGAEVVLYGFTSFLDGYPVSMPCGVPAVSQSSIRVVGAEYFKLPHFAWLKFMRASLLADKALRFPVGHYYEDWPFHWEVGFVTQHVEELRRPLYHYRQRGDSITGSGGRKLFHIFSAHQLVAKVVERHAAAPEIRRALAAKIHSGTWFLLNTIDAGLLDEAVVCARENLFAMRQQRRYGSPGLKIGVLLVALRFPQPLASAAVRCIRAAATALSSSRRNMRRDSAAAA